MPRSIAGSLNKKKEFDSFKPKPSAVTKMYSKSDLLKMILENDTGSNANNASALERTVGNLTIRENEGQTQSGSLNFILKKQLRNDKSTIVG